MARDFNTKLAAAQELKGSASVDALKKLQHEYAGSRFADQARDSAEQVAKVPTAQASSSINVSPTK